MDSIRRIIELCKDKKEWLKMLDQEETELLYNYVQDRYTKQVLEELSKLKPGQSEVKFLVGIEDFIEDYKVIYLASKQREIGNLGKPKSLLIDNSKLTQNITFKHAENMDEISLKVGHREVINRTLLIPPGQTEPDGYDKEVLDVLATYGLQKGYPYTVSISQIGRTLYGIDRKPTKTQEKEILKSLEKCITTSIKLDYKKDNKLAYLGTLLKGEIIDGTLIGGRYAEYAVLVTGHPLIERARLNNQALTVNIELNRLPGVRQDRDTIAIRGYVKSRILAHRNYLNNTKLKKRKQNFNTIKLESFYRDFSVNTLDKKATQKARTKLFNVLDSYKQDKHIANYKIEGKHPIKSVTFYLQK